MLAGKVLQSNNIAFLSYFYYITSALRRDGTSREMAFGNWTSGRKCLSVYVGRFESESGSPKIFLSSSLLYYILILFVDIVFDLINFTEERGVAIGIRSAPLYYGGVRSNIRFE